MLYGVARQVSGTKSRGVPWQSESTEGGDIEGSGRRQGAETEPRGEEERRLDFR